MAKPCFTWHNVSEMLRYPGDYRAENDHSRQQARKDCARLKEAISPSLLTNKIFYSLYLPLTELLGISRTFTHSG
jgi:hypothetical protein